jgi:cytochrome c nitrite reductase small subunit
MKHARRWIGLVANLGTLRFVPERWRNACFLSLGAAAGLGLFVIHISRAGSYLSDSPETCINCHVMTTQYVTWQHSSHSSAATCNDCHVPHDSLASAYAFKARDGLWHATVFTMRWEPQVIRLSPKAIPVVENNCRRCHAAVIQDVSLAEPASAAIAAHEPAGLRCWDCHRETPHGAVRSLSTTPGVFQPKLPGFTSPRQEPRIGGRTPRSAKEMLP